VIALDILLIFTGLTEDVSLGVSLLVCGWLYFPFRQWLWQRIVNKNAPGFEKLLPELSIVAFTPSLTEQRARWEALLKRVFDPLELRESTCIMKSTILEDGLGLQIPACGSLPAYSLRYAGNGARLFSSRDAAFSDALSQLLEQIASGRVSYEQGVVQERLRIGRDLHDNIGARLLKLIHHLRGTPNAEVARDAMKDLRTAIASMDTTPVPLANALADWRAEAGSRCEAANCLLHWQQGNDLPAIELRPRIKATLESVMRELITNALKHATPDNIEIQVMANMDSLQITVSNDGRITDPLDWQSGYGLRNIRGRLEELHGKLIIATGENKVRLTIEALLT
jgi:signal transduction histidine kinase